jgi:hypothetical protein
MPSSPTSARILQLARSAGILRPRDADAVGIPGNVLARVAPRAPHSHWTEPFTPFQMPLPDNHSLAEAGKRVPRGVVCLLSALRYHDLTAQAPFEVWMAIGEKDRRPN